MNEKQVARFWSKVDKRDHDECWPWKAGVTEKGYGRYMKSQRAHRVAYEIAHGVNPGALFVLHSCDNPPCCNPRHLFLGTAAENTEDMLQKQRHAHGEVSYAKLSEADVRSIRRLRDKGWTHRGLAERFGVTHATIQNVIHRRRWKHIA